VGSTYNRTISIDRVQTDIEAGAPGYVEKVLVDQGSLVRHGQLLVQLLATRNEVTGGRF
jgi:multidrug resistance efflux pump